MLKQFSIAMSLMTFACLPTAFANTSDTVNVSAAVTAYAHVDCANPSSVTLTTTTTSPADTAGYTSSGAQTITCSMLTNSSNASISLTLSGANYNNTNSRITTTHSSVGSQHLTMELSNASGFAAGGDGGLLTGGNLTPNSGVNLETASSFGWDINVLTSLSTPHLAGSYTGAFNVSLSGY